MKIFLLEDDKQLNIAIVNYFELLDYQTKSFFNGEDAINNINKSYDLFLIDINVPRIDGLSVLKYIKQVNPNAIVFMISSLIDLQYIKQAYDLGCDDYIKKPFFIEELELKISTVFQNIYLDENMYYDRKNKKLFKDNESIKLTKKETLLLNLFLCNINKVVSKEEIIEFLYDEAITDGAIRILINRLRKIIGSNIIKTILGIGYELSINKT